MKYFREKTTGKIFEIFIHIQERKITGQNNTINLAFAVPEFFQTMLKFFLTQKTKQSGQIKTARWSCQDAGSA